MAEVAWLVQHIFVALMETQKAGIATPVKVANLLAHYELLLLLHDLDTFGDAGPSGRKRSLFG